MPTDTENNGLERILVDSAENFHPKTWDPGNISVGKNSFNNINNSWGKTKEITTVSVVLYVIENHVTRQRSFFK